MSPASDDLMPIGELARRTGASPRSLRYYEQQQLLLSERTSGGRRRYDADAVERVELIKLLLAAGVPSASIVELLPCIYSGTTTPAMIERLDTERERIRAEHERLTRTLERLDRVIDEASSRLEGARAA